MPQKKEALKQIRTTLLSRGFSLFSASLKAKHSKQMDVLVHELGQLKGTAMKAAQTLSVYGEHLLPKELNDLLKKLQRDSAPLSWAPILQVLRTELGEKLLSELEVDESPLACASIGQVHRARQRSTGLELALKIQYPGVEQAIASDLRLLKFVLNISGLLPRGPNFDQIFAEIDEMMRQEVDYVFEARALDHFHDLLKSDSRFSVPQSIPAYSTRRVLAMTYLDGARIDSAEVKALSQERRNRLGHNFLDLYLHELLDLRRVQTDPHFGNYLVQIDPDGTADRIVLLDFGAVREIPDEFFSNYVQLISGGFQRDRRKVEAAGRNLGLLQPEDSMEHIDDFIALCLSLVEPFDGEYDWGGSDLPRRLSQQAGRLIKKYKFRTPPRELIFLDRKLGGVFIFLSKLNCKMNCRGILESRLAEILVR